MIAKGSRTAALIARDALAVAPAVALFLGLTIHEILLNPTWVADDSDEGAYFLMSRNIWHYGVPLLDQSGPARWSTSWSPGLSILLAPLGALPKSPSVVAERAAVMLTGVVFLVLGYVWMRRQLGLTRLWTGAATACVAVSYALVRVGALVMSDVPAAAAVIGGVVLLRSERNRAGLALLVVAALLRPINVAALGAALAWLLLAHRDRRPSRAVAIAAVVATSLIAIVLAAGGFRGYFSQFAHPGDGGIPRTLVDQSKELTWYPLGWFRAGLIPAPDDLARALLKLLSLGLVVLTAVVAVRRRLWLEAMIVAATIAVLLMYRTAGAGEARYLIPLSPFFVGAVFAGFRLIPWPWAASVVAAFATCAAIAAGIRYYVDVTPSTEAFSAEIAAKRGAYQWIRAHVPRSAEVVSVNDFQSFLYSGHPTVTGIHNFAPGRTFVVRTPPDSWDLRHLLDGFRGHEVYRRGDVSIVQVDARTTPPS